MSSPNNEQDHWHQLKTKVGSQVKRINQGKASDYELKNERNIRNLFYQLKNAFDKSLKKK